MIELDLLMPRKKRDWSEDSVREFGNLPTFLSDIARDAIQTGMGEDNRPISEDQKSYLEWLAEGFGLTPKWKQTQVEGSRGGKEG
jgi:hypothetical protein